MKVAEFDPVIYNLLDVERKRSQKALLALLAKTEKLPRGALNVRRKQVGSREYRYHYLVRREGKKIINRHVAERDMAALREQMAEREKYRAEIRIYRQRLACLERLLR